MRRRAFLALPLLVATTPSRAGEGFPAVLPGAALRFPRDHGSHPAYRNEWWYVTAWVRARDGERFGVQVTFFRNRPGIAESSASAFAPRELLFAHAAIADAGIGRLVHDQRAARAGLGLASASTSTTDVRLDDWSLVREGERYRARVRARDFAIDLAYALQLLQAFHARDESLPCWASVPQNR